MKRPLAILDAQHDATSDQLVHEQIFGEAVGTKVRWRDARRIEEAREVLAGASGRKRKGQGLTQSGGVDRELRLRVQDIGDQGHAGRVVYLRPDAPGFQPQAVLRTASSLRRVASSKTCPTERGGPLATSTPA
jgi:hypothetical protein